ncbi:MAG: cytidylate kinase-like family protein [Lachnospiraceae bacterium]|nr:cytidylate kinase-like family protein [Lachnospiraceae bacterium]
MKHFVIAIGREFGSGGAEIGKMLAARLGVKCYDRTLIDLAVEKTGFVKDCLVQEDESMTVLRKSLLSIGSTGTPLIADELMQAECDIIRQLADGESCVIVGRCADYVLEDRTDVMNIFICAPDSYRIERVMKDHDLPKDKAARFMRKKSSQRAGYYKYVTGDEMGNNSRNQLRVNSAAFGGSENTARMLEAAVRIRFEED